MCSIVKSILAAVGGEARLDHRILRAFAGRVVDLHVEMADVEHFRRLLHGPSPAHCRLLSWSIDCRRALRARNKLEDGEGRVGLIGAGT